MKAQRPLLSMRLHEQHLKPALLAEHLALDLTLNNPGDQSAWLWLRPQERDFILPAGPTFSLPPARVLRRGRAGEKLRESTG